MRINSQKMSLQWTKVPDGLAHMSIGLLPLVQSSSTIMDVQARLQLHMVHTADSVTIDQRTNTLQLMSLQITSQ